MRHQGPSALCGFCTLFIYGTRYVGSVKASQDLQVYIWFILVFVDGSCLFVPVSVA
jgi:hypothetical protein